MHEVPTRPPADLLPPGAHHLGIGPPMLGLRQFAYRYTARGAERGEGCVVVTTDRSAAAVVEGLAEAGLEGTDRVGIVDATGREPRADLPVETVGSPADLTGIGIGVSKLLERLHAAGADGYRILLDSLSTLLVYAEFDRVYQFLHTLTGRVGDAGGESLTLLSADTDGGAVGRLQGLFDGVLELREGDDGAEYRVRGGDDGDGGRGWHPVGLEAGAPDRSPVEPTPTEAADPELLAAVESADSLRGMIDAVAAAGGTLSVLNPTDEAALEAVTSALSRENVTVRSVELPTATPADAALLHRGAEAVACSPMAELQDAVRVDGGGARPDVLSQAAREEYTVENGGKLRMVRISRLVERRALETGTGTLHAGFQRLDRLTDELDTRTLYESIADTDVTVHLYGEGGEVPAAERYVLHSGDSRELSDGWFVVYDGGGRPDRAAALVSEETAPGRYSGFWTYQPALVAAVDGYLSSQYLT